MFTRIIERGPAAFPNSSVEMPKPLRIDYLEPLAERLIIGLIKTNAMTGSVSNWRRLATQQAHKEQRHTRFFHPERKIYVFDTVHEDNHKRVVTGGVTQFGGNNPPEIVKIDGEQQVRHDGPAVTFYIRARDYNAQKILANFEPRKPEILDLELRYDPGTGERDICEVDYMLEDIPPVGGKDIIDLTNQVANLLESISEQ